MQCNVIISLANIVIITTLLQVKPGTSCLFMSSGHIDTGFVLELFCDVDHCVVNLN